MSNQNWISNTVLNSVNGDHELFLGELAPQKEFRVVHRSCDFGDPLDWDSQLFEVSRG